MTGHIVVTGAAGFIGSHLCDRLLADGHAVVGIDSFSDYYPRLCKEANIASAQAHPRFTLLEADILDLVAEAGADGGAPTDLEDRGLIAALRGSTCVYHLAAQAGVRASWGSSFEGYARNNILGTQRLLEACVAAQVPKVVYASSSSVYGDQDDLPLREDMTPRPRSPYGVTKLAGEHLCRLYAVEGALDAVSLRLFTVYGPRQRPDMAFHRFIRALLEDREIVVYGDGTQTRDFTYVDDVVDALVGATRAAAGTVMNIGGGHRVTLAETIATLGRIIGVKPRIVLRAVEAGDVKDTLASVDVAAEAIGYRPAMSLAAGLESEYGWLAIAGAAKQ